jgi:hypothetical protein
MLFKMLSVALLVCTDWYATATRWQRKRKWHHLVALPLSFHTIIIAKTKLCHYSSVFLYEEYKLVEKAATKTEKLYIVIVCHFFADT